MVARLLGAPRITAAAIWALACLSACSDGNRSYAIDGHRFDLACSRVGSESSADTTAVARERTFEGNDSFWSYNLAVSQSESVAVAVCRGSFSDPPIGTCSAFGWFKDLVYSFTFNEGEVALLASRRAEISALLARWEVQT